MQSLVLILTALLLSLLSGLPGLFLSRDRAVGQRLACGGAILASLIGFGGALPVLFGAEGGALVLDWRLLGEQVSLEIDPLGAFFLIPVLVMNALGAVYGLGYWPQSAHADNGRRLSLFWGVLNAGMMLLLVSRHMVLFLFGWELMALAAYFLVCTDECSDEARVAGWHYLVATHLGTLMLFALIALLATTTHSFTMRAITSEVMGRGAVMAAFGLAFLGFGLKAGVMPLHFWLPGAHAAAPSHVSAMLSGVVLKMGVYGLMRFLGYLPDLPMACGVLVLFAGCVSGVLGVVFALAQHDLKRLLAYHSIENIGIIMMGFGLALIGRAADRPLWVVLGLAGSLLHVWNHGLFKALLFFGAGSVIHAVETRRIDRLGGLAAAMPWTAGLFLIGAVAICGLPPLNGFVSEWFIYLGFFQSVADNLALGWSFVALGVPVLGIIGALALACFVIVFGAVFLGQPRQERCPVPHESPLTMRVPMGVLAAACIVIGLCPWSVASVLDRAVTISTDMPPLANLSVASLVPLTTITVTGLALIGATLLLLRLLQLRLRRRTGHANTWSCGYARPTVRMQYTASSLAQMLTGLFHSVLAPRTRPLRILSVLAEPAGYESHQDDPVLDRLLLPAARLIRWLCDRARPLQRGLTHQYLIYVALTVIALLAWTLPIGAMIARLLAL